MKWLRAHLDLRRLSNNPQMTHHDLEAEVLAFILATQHKWEFVS